MLKQIENQIAYWQEKKRQYLSLERDLKAPKTIRRKKRVKKKKSKT